MTLGRKLTLKITAQLVGVAIIGGIGLWGLTSLRAALDQTTDQFGVMRTIHRVGHHLTMARMLAQKAPADLEAAHQQINSALRAMEEPLSMDSSALRTSDYPEARVLLAILKDTSLETDPRRLESHATSAIAAVQGVTQSIQREVRARRESAIEINKRAVLNLSIAGSMIVLLSALVGVSQQRSVMRPLRSLCRGVDRLRQGDFSRSVECSGDREFAMLAAQFNEMAIELRCARETLEERVEERTSQLIRSERLARLGVLAAGFAHEINNPLAIIRGHAELALRHWNSDPTNRNGEEPANEMADALTVTLEEIDRSKQIVDRLQSLGVREHIENRELAMHDVVTTAIRLVEPLAHKEGCSIQYEAVCDPSSAQVVGNEGELVQVVINLLLNAISATSKGGEVSVVCSREFDGVSVRITDDGVGMSRQELARAFDPFVSGNGGVGLGLAVCQAIADRHGARVIARSDGPGSGSVFSLHLPACAEEAAA